MNLKINERTAEMMEDSRQNGGRAGRAMNGNWNRLAKLTRMYSTQATKEEISMRIRLQNAFSCAGSHEKEIRAAAIAEASLEK